MFMKKRNKESQSQQAAGYSLSLKLRKTQQAAEYGLSLSNQEILERTIFSSVGKSSVHAIVLFGSRAREDFTNNSDYDINVYLSREHKNTRRILPEGLDEAYQVTFIDPVRFRSMEEQGHPFVYCSFRDGIPLYQRKEWFDFMRLRILTLRPSEKITRDYFRYGLRNLSHLIHCHSQNSLVNLPLTLELEDGKVAANQIGFALMMYHGTYPQSPHTLRKELRVFGTRYRNVADTISYLQKAYYSSRESRVSSYTRHISFLYSFAKDFVRKLFPQEYLEIQAHEKILRKL